MIPEGGIPKPNAPRPSSNQPSTHTVPTGSGYSAPHNALTAPTSTQVKTPKNMPKPRGNGKPSKKIVDPLVKTARTLVSLTYKPQLQAIHRAGQQATQQYQTGAQRSSDIYSALGNQLAALIGPYQQGMAGVTSGLQSQIAGLPATLTEGIGAAPPAEIAAGNNLVGTTATGALSQLAGDQARNLAYNTSAQRQGVEQNAVTQQNSLTDLQNFRNDLGQQRLDVRANMPAAILAELQQLQQQQTNNSLARGQLAVAQGGLGVQQGQLGLQSQMQNYTMQQQQAMAAFMQQLAGNPQALAAYLGLGGTLP